MLYLITRNDRVVVAVGYMYPFYVVRTSVGKRKFRAPQVLLPEQDCRLVFGLRIWWRTLFLDHCHVFP